MLKKRSHLTYPDPGSPLKKKFSFPTFFSSEPKSWILELQELEAELEEFYDFTGSTRNLAMNLWSWIQRVFIYIICIYIYIIYCIYFWMETNVTRVREKSQFKLNVFFYLSSWDKRETSETCFWCKNWNVAVPVKKLPPFSNYMLSNFLRCGGQSIQDTVLLQSKSLFSWCVWHHKSWLEMGLLSSNTKKHYYHGSPWITISFWHPSWSPQGEITERITDPQQRLASAWQHGVGSADPKSAVFHGRVFRSIFRFFDEDRDGFLSHEDEDHVFAYENCCEMGNDGNEWLIFFSPCRSYQSFGVPLRRKKMVNLPSHCSRVLVLRPSKSQDKTVSTCSWINGNGWKR